MREIKFRAWDIVNKMMGLVSTWNGMREVGEYAYIAVDEYNGNAHFAVVKTADAILMQFTGLHDKNGKDIYEGDIFDCMYLRDGHTNHRYSVIFNEFSAAFDLQRHGEPCPQVQVRQTVKDHAGWRGTVIGNIYENPELITNK